jgi:hypothetical protein
MYLNALLVNRWIQYTVRLKYGINHSEIEVLLCVEKLTSGNLGYCVSSDLKVFLTGHALRNTYTAIPRLIKEDFLFNNGKHKYYLSLTDKGNEAVSYINEAMNERVGYLNDKLKLKSVEVIERNKKSRKKKALPLVENKEKDYLLGEN